MFYGPSIKCVPIRKFLKNKMKTNTTDCSSVIFDEDELIVENDDEDLCTEHELENKFSEPYFLSTEEAVSLSKNYILDIVGTSEENSQFTIGIALSDQSCSIYKLSGTSLTKTKNFKAHSKAVSNIKFSPDNEQLFFTGSVDGTIKLWDLRTSGSESVKIFQDESCGSTNLKPITSFDVSQNGRILCGGTELFGGDAFLLFWDLRSSSLLGGYWESHTDDITQVKFHKTNKDYLASGSTDGLVNIYNISESSEDDALLYTYNTESSVEKINWFVYEGKKDAIHCLTHTACLDLWKIEDGEAYAKFSREQISKALLRKSAEDAYVANIHELNETGDLFLVSGSNVSKGECLRTLKIEKSKIKPLSQLLNNKQIVRSSWYDQNKRILVTGGESGILSIWLPGDNTSPTKSASAKSISNIKDSTRKLKPY